MLGNIRWKWKQGKIKTIYLLALAVFFVGAYIWRPSFGQNNQTTGQKAAAAVEKAKPAGVEKHEEFHAFAPLRSDKYTKMEQVGLWVVLIIAVLGLLTR